MKKAIIVLAVLFCMFALCADTADSKTIVDQFSYIAGANAFAEYASYYELNVDSFAKGAQEYADGKYNITSAELNSIINTYSAYLAEKIETQKKENLAYAETFLAANKKKSGVKTTESGLQYKITKKGKGATATENSTVTVHYTLTDPNGVVIDSSYNRGEPSTFSLQGVVPGFAEACMVAPVGSKLTAWLHPSIGYGEQGGGSVEPNMLLKFDIEIISIN